LSHFRLIQQLLWLVLLSFVCAQITDDFPLYSYKYHKYLFNTNDSRCAIGWRVNFSFSFQFQSLLKNKEVSFFFLLYFIWNWTSGFILLFDQLNNYIPEQFCELYSWKRSKWSFQIDGINLHFDLNNDSRDSRKKNIDKRYY
jgi:hypothetical protein